MECGIERKLSCSLDELLSKQICSTQSSGDFEKEFLLNAAFHHGMESVEWQLHFFHQSKEGSILQTGKRAWGLKPPLTSMCARPWMLKLQEHLPAGVWEPILFHP